MKRAPLRLPWILGVAAVLAAAGAAPAAQAPSSGTTPVRYGRDVRPLLADRCFACHGPDEGKRQANLRLDQFEAATADRPHGAAIVPGEAEASLLLQRASSADPEQRMPPEESHKRALDARELELLRSWIDAGAHYEEHWSFQAPVRPALPTLRNPDWPMNAVDAFVAAQLESRAIAPSAQAGAATLVRRLFLDVTGLPPNPEELAAFLAECELAGQDQGAFDALWLRWIDKLLTTEPYVSRYAERMAVPWLDAARYADTSGIHMDAGRQVWAWRDWVLKAFRDNLSYDRFLADQLAGDLVPEATLAQKVASGFNRNHVTTDEGGAIDAEYLVEYAVDRTATTGLVFLGLTLGCARCHDHKYDPITQQDFYSFYAYFNSIEEPGLYSQVPDANRALEPFLEVPTLEQTLAIAATEASLTQARSALDAPVEGEEQQRAELLAELRSERGVQWAESTIEQALSSGGALLEPQEDGSVLATGSNPEVDHQTFQLHTAAHGLRLLLVEALADPRLPEGRVGRAPNGNAVLTEVVAEVFSSADPAQHRSVHFQWAWADHVQPDGDFSALNTIDGEAQSGWAVDAHRRAGPRALLLLADQDFGYEGGSTLQVELRYDSVYAQHVLGRVRLCLGALDDALLARLPLASSGWQIAGPFESSDRGEPFAKRYGPEEPGAFPSQARFLDGKLGWMREPRFADGRLNGEFPQGVNATYVAKTIAAPSARRVAVSLGSDDGFKLYLDGLEIGAREVDRGLLADQDQLEFDLPSGTHALVFKIVNTGGEGGFYWREQPVAGELAGALLAGFLPAELFEPHADDFTRAWRLNVSPGYRERLERTAELERQLALERAQVSRTMVMKELAEPRPTYVLTRGQYDHPDLDQPVQRGVPRAFGALPEGAPADRRGLVAWMLAPEQPLVARVFVNRLWEQVFGKGIVRTSEDFGLQGEWPSHPELLDWLAVEFREQGWDIKQLMRTLLASRTYRQESQARPELRELDPENRLLAFFPRQRLGAEQLRDQALYVSGLLVEKFGGVSVKPYQPEGLWQEVAMPSSNTRLYERGMGDDLWRRSLYTYWKRACPPPALMSFDAPTREFCLTRRSSTNTPLQALVLWNDEQFVEAARMLAARTLAETEGDEPRLRRMFERCVAREPEPDELQLLLGALQVFRERYAAAPADAAALLAVGEVPSPMGLDQMELAALAMVANALLSMDATLTRN